MFEEVEVDGEGFGLEPAFAGAGLDLGFEVGSAAALEGVAELVGFTAEAGLVVVVFEQGGGRGALPAPPGRGSHAAHRSVPVGYRYRVVF